MAKEVTKELTDKNIEVLHKYRSLDDFRRLAMRAIATNLAGEKHDEFKDACTFFLSLSKEDSEKILFFSKAIAEQMVDEIIEDQISGRDKMFN